MKSKPLECDIEYKVRLNSSHTSSVSCVFSRLSSPTTCVTSKYSSCSTVITISRWMNDFSWYLQAALEIKTLGRCMVAPLGLAFTFKLTNGHRRLYFCPAAGQKYSVTGKLGTEFIMSYLTRRGKCTLEYPWVATTTGSSGRTECTGHTPYSIALSLWLISPGNYLIHDFKVTYVSFSHSTWKRAYF